MTLELVCAKFSNSVQKSVLKSPICYKCHITCLSH